MNFFSSVILVVILNFIEATEFHFKCGHASEMMDMCFNDLSPDMEEIFSSIRIPGTLTEIQNKCNLFQHGISCVTQYINQCISPADREIVEKKIHGAKTIYGYLCESKGFQQEFLRHKECLHHIRIDWERCSNEYLAIIKEEFLPQQRFNSVRSFHYCCIRYGYENCVFNSARYKCKVESAIFVRNLAKKLSSADMGITKHCFQANAAQICSSAPTIKETSIIILLTSLISFCSRCLKRD